MVPDKKRIYQLAKDFKISSNAMLSILRELKFQPKSHMSVATSEMISAVTKKFAEEKKEAKRRAREAARPEKLRPGK